MDQKKDARIHPIIDRPWEFQVIEFFFAHDPSDDRTACIDLTLQNGSITRRLRFSGVQALSIEEGFPRQTHGLCILDITDWQWDGLKVKVDDFEASHGAIRFFAYDVVDLDAD